MSILRPNISVYLILSVTFFLIASTISFADGGYVWNKTFLGQAKSGGQKAVVLFFNNIETLVLQTNYEGELADFSWLIPSPSPVTANDVRDADANLFFELDDLTAPTFYLQQSSNTGCSCSGPVFFAVSDYGPDSTDKNHLEVLETILTETYEVNVLTASDVQDLVDWFDQNEYTYPAETEAVLEDYIRRGWYFLAIRIRPSDTGSVIKQSLAPIQISFETGQPVFPLMISSLSSEYETDILIHLISDHRYKTSNVVSKEVDYISANDPNNYKSEYNRWMKAQVEDQYGQLYFVEYAGWLPDNDCLSYNSYFDGEPFRCDEGVFITRFRSYFSPDLFMDDIYFDQDANDDYFSVTVDIWNSSVWHSSLFFANLFFLFATFVTPKRFFSNRSKILVRLGPLIILCLLIF